MKMSRRRKITILVLVAVMIVLAVTSYTNRGAIGFIVAVYLYGIPDGSEVDEASGIVPFVVNNYHFAKMSKSEPYRPLIYCQPGGTGLLGQSPHTVIVYTVTNPVDQEKIIALISSYRAQKNLRHVRLKFYREENWRTYVNKDGSRSYIRGKEELIRTERL